MFVDSHAHLQWSRFDRDREEVLHRAREAQVDNVVNIGFDVNGSIKGVKLFRSLTDADLPATSQAGIAKKGHFWMETI